MNTSDIVIVDASRVRQFCAAVFAAIGVPADHAGTIGDVLIETDLRGVESHGLALLGLYVDCLTSGEVNPRPDIRALRDRPAIGLLDGDRGMGHVVSTHAMRLCLEKARKTGIAAVGVRNSCHFGMAAYYSMLALPHNMIGFATTNVTPIMVPFRGVTPTVGNNPLSYAIPAAPDLPLVIDLAVSVVAAGKIGLAERLDQPIPAGWAIDSNGKTVTNPADALADLRLEPMGGPKGYCLGVVMEALAGILTGAQFGQALFAPGRIIDQEVGHFFWALDIAAFAEPAEFRSRMTALIAEIRSTRPVEASTPVWIPGEPELRHRAKRLVDGIPLRPEIWSELGEIANRLGLTDQLQAARRGGDLATA